MPPPSNVLPKPAAMSVAAFPQFGSLIFRRGMIDVDFVHLRNAFNRRAGRTLFGYGEGKGEEAGAQSLERTCDLPMLHLPDVSKA